jgi:hypothetical protein
MSVEIWLAETKFSISPQNMRVYDDFSIKPANSSGAYSRMGLAATVPILAVVRALERQGEK